MKKIVDNEKEIWKSHPDIEKIEVSSFGRVRSVKGHYYKSRPNRNGYLQASFSMNGKFITKYVHRLVAQTFIANPENFPEVNHKDGNRANNNASNLEWCSRSYNMKYREKYGVSQTEAAGHPLFAINLDTLEVSHFRSQSEAGRVLGIKQSSINAVISGRLKQNGGYWFLSDDGHAVDIVKSNLHDVGGTGLKIKYRTTLKTR